MIVQVERLSACPANPKEVKVPGILVDAIVVAPEKRQILLEKYDPTYSGELRIPDDQINGLLDSINSLNRGAGKERSLAHWIVARRAAMELQSGNVVNLGIGIPEIIGSIIKKSSNCDVTFTVESGTIGGVPSTGISFGATINSDVIYDQSYQFDLYDGGTLDVTCVGALEIDQAGNVNVSRLGSTIVGVGGFINITQTSKKVVICATFSTAGLELVYNDNQLINHYPRVEDYPVYRKGR